MIKIVEGSTHFSGTMIDITSEMQSGLLTIVRVIRENGGDEKAIMFMKETESLMNGYTKGMNRGLSFEECNQMAVDEMIKLAKE